MNRIEAANELATPRLSSEQEAQLDPYLHIYKVSQQTDSRGAEDSLYVGVASLGRNRTEAEQIAINQVHQRGYRILFTDTATAAPWLNGDVDEPFVRALSQYGAAVQELAAWH